MEKAGEKPSFQKVATRLGGKFRQPHKNVVKRWKDRGWTEAPPNNKGRQSPNEEAQADLTTAVAVATGKPTLTMPAFMESEEVKALIPDLENLALPELVRLAAEEQFKTLIAMSRLTRKMVIEGRPAVVDGEGEGDPPKTVNEPVPIPHMSGLVAALSGSFSTSTSVAEKARDLSMKDVTPTKDGPTIEGTVVDRFGDVMEALGVDGPAAK